MQRLLAILLLVALAPSPGLAQQKIKSEPPPATDSPAAPVPAANSSLAEKRAWLREHLVKGIRSARQIRAVQTQVDRMTPKEINAAVNAALAQQLPPAAGGQGPQQLQQQAQWELQQARQLRETLEREYFWRRHGYGYGPAVGYAPVITWLPEGTYMGASGVVSPDRRYVRVNAMPFFSSIGPVYHYNMVTGETRLAPPYGYSPYAYPRSTTRPGTSSPYPPGWFGGSNQPGQ
jgi:hypothetical protein